MRPLLQDVREHHGISAMLTSFGAPRFTPSNLFPAALLCLIAGDVRDVHCTGTSRAKIIPDHRRERWR